MKLPEIPTDPLNHGQQQSQSASLSAQKISVAYGTHLAVNGVDLDAHGGQIGAIIGANGCGKSTFLRALARLVKPQGGTVILNGHDIAKLPTKRVATQLGILPQSPIAPDGITVFDLVSRGRYPYHRFGSHWSRQDQDAVEHALEVTHMSDFADRSVDQLSGGQRQRAWIALTLAQDTDIVLLDEPTTYLDVAYQLEVLDLLADLNAIDGIIIIMVIHDINLAARYADWILAMKDGTCDTFGTPSEVITPDVIRRVFGMDVRIIQDPESKTPMIIADSRHALGPKREILEKEKL
ncbi:MAG: ABC transporter ATP-binding protein [Bifidobacterium aquikefiri]|uniref:Coelichelin uptake porter, ABC transporter, ATP binding protein CchE n=1 Tax=Bifidobacterium aquikefiri TaxID=1653207 RepID=A0A261GBP7_9BIFI|nr:ABC transporter ATP-binding protein [Bifidobacterium aquikefiri]OZG68857.1 Coelichelin uptake porter, ABC transporter, ATP binding protein CchE [Bifidobacterium aquikefiri]